MHIRYLSLIDAPPERFVTGVPDKRDLLSGIVVLLAADCESAYALLPDFRTHVEGVLITFGAEAIERVGPLLWHVSLPRETFIHGGGLLSFALDAVSTASVFRNQTILDDLALKRLRTEFDIRDQDYLQVSRALLDQVVELSASEAKLAAILDGVDACIYLKDTTGRYLFANRATCELWQTGREDIIGYKDENFFDASTAADILSSDRQVFDCGETTRVERCIAVPAKGIVAMLQTTKLPLRRDDGSIYALCGISTDVTALSERERLFRTLAENFPDPIARFDRDCRHTYVNPAVSKAFGIPHEYFIGKRLNQLPIQSRQSETLNSLIRRAFSEGVANEFEAHWRTDTGERIFEVRHVPEMDGEGKVVSVLGIGRDITHLRATELALRSSVREYRTLAENLPENIMRYDAERRLTFMNGSCARMLGLDAQSCRGLTLTKGRVSGVNQPIPKDFEAALRHTLNTGEASTLRVVFDEGPNQGKVHDLRFAAERDVAGQVFGAVVIGYDISELVDRERQITESRDLLRSLAARRDSAREEERKRIARELHDELGQVLTAQRLEIATLTLQFGGDNPLLAAQCGRLIDISDRTIQSVRNIASDLRPSALDAGIVPALQWLASKFETSAAIPCRVSANQPDVQLDGPQSIALFRIVQESLTNVMRHAEARQVDVFVDTQAEHCKLSIRDDGRGFDVECIGRNSLGLLGIRERAQMVGGEARIASSGEQGTTIDVCIPRRRKRKRAERLAP